MKLTTKLTAITLGLALPLSIVSCKDGEKKAAEVVADSKDKVQKVATDSKAKVDAVANNVTATAKEAMAAIPTNASGIVGIFDKMNTELENVKDLDSAKQALPALANAGKMVKKGIDAIGGEEKMEAAIKAAPELQAKFGATMGTLMGHMQRIKAASPEAYEFIDKKMDAIMK